VTNLFASASGAERSKRVEFARGWGLPALLGLTVAIVFLIGGARLIGIGADDFGIVGLFSTDEQLAGQLVEHMLQAGNLDLSHFYSYGPLDLYAARALLLPYQLTGRVDQRAIIVSLRLVSLAAGAGCLLVTYALGRRMWDAWAGAAGVAMLFSSVTFLSWSTTAHPDMLQLLFLLLGIWSASILVSSHTRGASMAWLLLGSFFAALAFATKYSGELLLPVLWVTSAVARNGKASTDRPGWPAQLGQAAVDIGCSAIVFLAIVSLLEVEALHDWHSFIYQVALEGGLAHNGHLLRAAVSPLGWLPVLASTDVLGPIGLVTGSIGLAAWTVADTRRFISRPGASEWRRLPLELFTIGYLVFLLTWIGDQQARYALPVLPGLALAAGGSVVWLTRRGRLWTFVAAAVLALALLPLLSQTAGFARAQSSRMNSASVADRVAAGRWMATRFPGGATVIADAYSYVPSSFASVYQSFGLTREMLQTMRPDVVVTNSAIRDRFRNPELGSQYVDGADAYNEIAATYKELESGRSLCYTQQNRFGPVAIYARLAGC
jgi:Dolichyl-phosphate-mannose-protein mannosyltransferase